ncbi:hypothetical protein Tco_0635806 [Tanacetum coccineum]
MHMYNQNESATLDGSDNMLDAGPMTVFGGGGGGGGSGVIQQGMKIPAGAATGASLRKMKRTTPLTEAELRLQIFKKPKDASVKLNVPVSGLTRAAEDLGWSRWLGESGKRILFIHVTRTSDGSTDALNIPKSASLPRLKNELKDSFTQLVPNTYNIRYHGKAIETDLAWKNSLFALDSALPMFVWLLRWRDPWIRLFGDQLEGRGRQQEFSELSSFNEFMVLSTIMIGGIISLSTSGEFSVKDTRLAIDDLVLPSHSEPD